MLAARLIMAAAAAAELDREQAQQQLAAQVSAAALVVLRLLQEPPELAHSRAAGVVPLAVEHPALAVMVKSSSLSSQRKERI
jgi:hypothetical protein